jgi:hypothetical protein
MSCYHCGAVLRSSEARFYCSGYCVASNSRNIGAKTRKPFSRVSSATGGARAISYLRDANSSFFPYLVSPWRSVDGGAGCLPKGGWCGGGRLDYGARFDHPTGGIALIDPTRRGSSYNGTQGKPAHPIQHPLLYHLSLPVQHSIRPCEPPCRQYYWELRQPCTNCVRVPDKLDARAH